MKMEIILWNFEQLIKLIASDIDKHFEGQFL